MSELSLRRISVKSVYKKVARPRLKKAMDRLFSLPFFVVSVPVIGLAAIAIKIVSPGPAFYAQERVGHKGKLIKVLKLRTMHVDADRLLKEHLAESPEAEAEWNTFFKLKKDPRIIPVVGHFLRKSSLDELPQLWNVVRGDMSLVGPRPFPQYHLDAFPKEFQLLRQQVVPGLTGLWQVSARSDGDVEVQQALDTQYIEQPSLRKDLKIIFKTVQVVVLQKGAC